jgi:hypothetical protein
MKLRVTSTAVACCLVASAALAQTRAQSCLRIETSSGPVALRAPGSRTGPTTSVFATNSPRFSATKILDLTLAVLLPPSFEGGHLVELRVFTPDGQLYRSLTVPFAKGALPGAARAVEGYARPVPQLALQRVSRGRSLFAAASTTLPVGGTDIVSSGLYGCWRVEAYLDGAEQRCGPVGLFTLSP